MDKTTLSVTECKAKLDSMGWKFNTKSGTNYEFMRKPARGRAPKKRYAVLKISELRQAAASETIKPALLRETAIADATATTPSPATA